MSNCEQDDQQVTGAPFISSSEQPGKRVDVWTVKKDPAEKSFDFYMVCFHTYVSVHFFLCVDESN